MQFTLISIFALISVALAVTQDEHNGWSSPLQPTRLSQRHMLTPLTAFIKRQANQASNVPVNVAAMTDKDGNVILFDSNGVYLDSVAKGL